MKLDCPYCRAQNVVSDVVDDDPVARRITRRVDCSKCKKTFELTAVRPQGGSWSPWRRTWIKRDGTWSQGPDFDRYEKEWVIAQTTWEA